MERKSGEWLKILTIKWHGLGKLRYALLLALLGIAIIVMPTEKTQESTTMINAQVIERSVEQRMEEILTSVHGAGKVCVMLTEKNEGKIEYQTDLEEFRNGDQTEIRSETVFGAQEALVRSKSAPDYLGAVVVCEGGDHPQVCLELVNAVCSLTGLTSDKVTVLKMKE